ncbi:hypothetical protein Tco_0013772 [Tanacetum coccineum]
MANLDFCDKHNMVAFLKKPEGSEGFHQIVDFSISTHIKYALTENPTIYVSLIHQFWQTASASTSENGEMEITATMMGPIFQGAIITVLVESHHTPTSAPSTSQPPTSPPSMKTTHVVEEAATMPHDSPLQRVHSLGSGEGISTAGAEVSTVSPEVKTTAESLVYIRRSEAKRKDKGKAIMVAEVELDHEGSKKQKINEALGSVQEQPEEETKLPQEDLQQMMMVVPVEEFYVEALQKFDIDDLDKLWSLVKEIFSLTYPTDDKERTLWVELKRLFEHDIDDILWKLQRYMHDPLTWRL